MRYKIEELLKLRHEARERGDKKELARLQRLKPASSNYSPPSSYNEANGFFRVITT